MILILYTCAPYLSCVWILKNLFLNLSYVNLYFGCYRIERVEAGLPADQAGLRPGDYVIFVEKTNVVTLPEEEILKLIK